MTSVLLSSYPMGLPCGYSDVSYDWHGTFIAQLYSGERKLYITVPYTMYLLLLSFPWFLVSGMEKALMGDQR